MKMKKIVIVLFALITLGFAQAQNDKEADVLLEKIAEKYKTYQTAKLDLNLKIKQPEADEEVVQKATFWLKKEMFKIDFEERVIVSDGTTQWTYLKEVNELQISHCDPSSLLFSPSQIFDVYSEEYIYRIREEHKNKKGEVLKQIEMSPIDKDLNIFKIILTVNTKTLNVESTEVLDKSGIRFAYEVVDLEKNPKLADDFFQFDRTKYDIDSDDIIDLR